MAVEDPDENNPIGIQLLLLDYPYATDGIEILVAIKQWVKDFCSFFHKDDEAIKADIELQTWWLEIQTLGHSDKHNETCWYQMTTLSNLVESLTTLIWVASTRHATLNYNQNAYNGYLPNVPTLYKKFIPLEGTIEFGEFLKDPNDFFLKMMPERFEINLVLALVEVLSRHTCDEVYLGYCMPSSPSWIDNEIVQNRFVEFIEELKEIHTRILQRYRDPKLKNRHGLAKIDYILLFPETPSSGLRRRMKGKGIPNSIVI